MKNSSLLLALLFLLAFPSCNKNDLVQSEADAQKFIDSAGITNITQKIALYNLVSQLKVSSLWTKFKAIYPMIGNTSITNKFNLKDPRDAVSAYTLTFYGSPVFTSTGILFPTINDYADTHFIDNFLTSDNASISYYSRTQNIMSGYDMGCTDGFGPYNELSIYSNEADNSEWFGFSQHILSPNTTGLFMLSSSLTNVTRYRNGLIVSAKGSAPNTIYTNLSILIGKSRQSPHSGQKECALATIGTSLTDAEAVTFYNIVNDFEKALNR